MPIPIEQRIVAIIISFSLLLVIVQLIRKHKLREEYALIWLAASLGIFFFSVFGGFARLLASLFAVSYTPTLFLVLGLLFALVVLVSQTVALSTQSNRVRDLAQHIALLEWQVRQLAKDRSKRDDTETGEANEDRKSTDHLPQPTTVARPKPLPNPTAHGGKVLVIGLDGATFDLINPWARDGYLPTFNRLMHEGAHGPLRSTIPPMTAPAWTSFATGTNPGKHRLYDWIAREPDSYRFSPVTALDGMAPTIYTLLSQAGRRVCTLNVPMTYPPVPVNGVMVSGMPAPSTQNTITYPAHLLQDILQAVGDYVLYPDPGQAYSDSGVDAFLDRLYHTTDIRVRAFDYLRERGVWDFAMLVFNGTDTVCHALWKYMDREHPLHDPGRYAKYGSAIRDYYQFIDKYLARIVETLDDDTTLVIMSDHGFGPFHKFIHVNNWLMEQGLMRVRPGLRPRLKANLFHLGFAPMNVYNLLMQLGLGALKREVVRGQGQGLLKRLFLSFEDVDWSQTQAYSLGNIGQIYVNLAGREPLGRVKPGAEYEQVRENIIARLWELRDRETGEGVVEAVYRREEIYSGDQVEHAPDILFLPRRLEYFGFGEYEFGSHKIIEAMKRGISGTHRMNGVFLAYGQAVQPGVQVKDAQIVDLAPTILHLMGEPIPEHMDGGVLKEILHGDVRPSQDSAQAGEWDGRPNGDNGGLTEEEKQALTDRLRSLGYVG
jgi:predicted AlkP superfamily phosphohydrolase/phosphomutase